MYSVSPPVLGLTLCSVSPPVLGLTVYSVSPPVLGLTLCSVSPPVLGLTVYSVSPPVLGLDTINWRQLHGSAADGRVELPSVTSFLEPGPASGDGPSVLLPKHNNYPRSRVTWDDHNAVLLPLKLLGIDAPLEGSTAGGGPMPRQHAAVSYILFRTLADLLPEEYADDVRRRWGVGVGAQSAALTLAVGVGDKMLSGETETPIRLMMRTTRLSAKSSPQCVRWEHNEE